ncbi:MAG: glycosyltransferase family 4 protein [Bacteroidales bacterium]|nr:glycosyltransferase family 4 protein [Bacteroidales bacterium]
MRLLILNYEYPPLGGGAGVCAQYHAEGLARLGYAVTVVTTWFKGEEDIENKDNLTIIRLHSRRRKIYRSNPAAMLSWAFRTIKYVSRNLNKLKPDLVMAHFAIPGGIPAVSLKIRKKLPYIVVSHGQDIPWFNPKELLFYHMILYLPIRYICRQAKQIVSLTDMRMSQVKNLVGARHQHKCLVIPNGCDTDFFTPSYADREKDTLTLLFTGRLTRQKDPFILLKALALLEESEVPFRLEIIGDGPLKKKMMQYVRQKGYAEKVRFAGWVSKDEIRTCYRQSDLLVVCSLDEGMSLAILEAMATGLYIVTTPVSGTGEQIIAGVNGETYPYRDSPALAKVIEAFYRNHFLPRKKIPQDVLEKQRHEISWEKVIKKIDVLLQK